MIGHNQQGDRANEYLSCPRKSANRYVFLNHRSAGPKSPEFIAPGGLFLFPKRLSEEESLQEGDISGPATPRSAKPWFQLLLEE